MVELTGAEVGARFAGLRERSLHEKVIEGDERVEVDSDSGTQACSAR